MERVRGIEPPSLAWEARALPLSYTRGTARTVSRGSVPLQRRAARARTPEPALTPAPTVAPVAPSSLAAREYPVTGLRRDGDVFILDLGDGENRFNPSWLDAVEAALDEVEGADGPRALVTSATGKFWSNGLDLAWMTEHPDQVADVVHRVHGLFARVLSSPVPSVAAIQGHCFAAGAMLSLAHDQRVARADRGFWCLPEVDIHIPFTPGMSALIQARLSPATAHQAMTTAHRYGGDDAAAAGIVDTAVPEERVLPESLERARALAPKAGRTLAAIKSGMYERALEALRRDIPIVLP
jgi:Delta3-Delta2-enoyl-CoA isomerase